MRRPASLASVPSSLLLPRRHLVHPAASGARDRETAVPEAPLILVIHALPEFFIAAGVHHGSVHRASRSRLPSAERPTHSSGRLAGHFAVRQGDLVAGVQTRGSVPVTGSSSTYAYQFTPCLAGSCCTNLPIAGQ